VYRNFAELSKTEREKHRFFVSRTVKRKESNTIIVAPHGGAIEPGTSEVAKEVAHNDFIAGHIRRNKAQNNNRLHITSTNFDEPRCVELVQESDTVVAIHGEGSSDIAVFLGGKNNDLGTKLKAALERYGYAVKTHRNPNGLPRELASTNICNRCRHMQESSLS